MRSIINKLSLSLLICFTALSSHAQRVNFDQVIQPFDQIAEDFEEFLVQLAWLNNPANDALNYRVNIADQNIKDARMGWWEAIGANVQYNPNNALGAPGDATFVLPRVSYGAAINLNPLFTTPGKIRIAKEEFKIAQSDVNQAKLAIRSETLQRYKKYELAIEVLKVRTKKEEDANANYQYQSILFQNNNSTFEEYNEAFFSYHNAVEARLEAETSLAIAKISLEEIIGIPMETAERYIVNVRE